jgi:PPOX class probable F420-dependent enzyme
MTREQLDTFLDEVHVAILATINKDGTPNPQPVWYLHRDGVFYISTEGSSRKGKNIARDARISICVQQETTPYKSVTVWGTATVGPHEKQISRDITVRYLGERGADAYLGDGEGSPDSILITLRPERVFSQDYTSDFGAAS